MDARYQQVVKVQYNHDQFVLPLISAFFDFIHIILSLSDGSSTITPL
jgi:hypothetical protein